MEMYLLKMFGLSLGLTILLELSVGFLFRMGKGKIWILMVLVNILTNPPAVLLCWMGCPQLPVEAAVVLVEAMIYLWFSRDESWTIPHPVIFAMVANSVSWLTGVLIQL